MQLLPCAVEDGLRVVVVGVLITGDFSRNATRYVAFALGNGLIALSKMISSDGLSGMVEVL